MEKKTRTKKAKTNEDSARNFCFCLYPDSMPENAIGMLLNEKIDIGISPLHEPDQEERKPHYHVIVCYKGKHLYKEINEKFREKYNCSMLQIVADRNKYTRYLLHLDDPDKQQFDEDQQISANYDIRPFLQKEVYTIDIVKEINARHISSFTTLVNIFTDECRFAEIEKISSKAAFFKLYFDKR